MQYKNLSEEELKDALTNILCDSVERIRKKDELSSGKSCLTNTKEKDNARNR